MPLSRENQREMHLILYGGTGSLETIILRKRDDDQRQGTVRSLELFDVRHSKITKTGNTLQGDMTAIHHTTWHIPIVELERVGVAYLSALDKIIQVGDGNPIEAGYEWQPEGDTQITVQLFGDHLCVQCHRRDSPGLRPPAPGADGSCC